MTAAVLCTRVDSPNKLAQLMEYICRSKELPPIEPENNPQ